MMKADQFRIGIPIALLYGLNDLVFVDGSLLLILRRLMKPKGSFRGTTPFRPRNV